MMNKQLVCSKKALEKTRQEDKMIKRNQLGKVEKGLTEVGVEKGWRRKGKQRKCCPNEVELVIAIVLSTFSNLVARTSAKVIVKGIVSFHTRCCVLVHRA